MSAHLRNIIIIVSLLIGSIFISKYSKNIISLYGDSMGYYLYLPATFIYGNLEDMSIEPKGKKMDPDLLQYSADQKTEKKDSDNKPWVNQYTYGVALMELPFFLMAHLYERVSGLPADGLSAAYTLAIFLCTLFYTFGGLWFCYKVLVKYVSSFIATLTLAIMLVATNLFWFTFAQIGMSHTPLFFLYAVLVFYTVQLHENTKPKYFYIIGLAAGLITLIRPTDVVCLLIPLLYSITDRNSLVRKKLLLQKNIKQLLGAAVLFVLPVLPQLLYWKWLTGKFLYYSYGNQKFIWDNPRIVEGLFHFSNGWLPYAPVMIFSLLGICLYRKQAKWLPVYGILLPLYVYIIYSWFAHDYPNGFGSRPMLHVYPLLAIPLAHFVAWVFNKGIAIKTAFAAYCIASIAIVFVLGSRMTEFKFRSEHANVQLYTAMLFNKNLSYKTLVSWDISEYQPDESKLTKIATLATEDFNTPLSKHFVPDPNSPSGFVYHMWDGEEYFPHEISLPYKKGMFDSSKWIKCSGDFMYTDYVDRYFPRIFVFAVIDKNGNFKTWKGCKVDNKIGISDSSCNHNGDSLMLQHYEYWKWSPVYFYTKVPDNLEEGDTIQLSIWNMNKKQLFFDNFCIELYR